MRKIIAIILCVVMILGLCSCGDTEDTNKQNAESTTAVDDAGEPSSVYDGVIGTFCELVSKKQNGEALPELSEDTDATEKALVTAASALEPEDAGYATKDINFDGVEELVIMSRACRLYALFTCFDDEVVLLMDLNGSVSCIDEDGNVYASFYDKDKYSIYMIKKINDGAMQGLEFGGVTVDSVAQYYKIENGIKSEITRDQLFDMSEYYSNLTGTHNALVNKKTGFRFVPVIDGAGGEAVSTLDFSSYDKILSVYRSIVDLMSGYSSTKWVNGEYDSMFSFADNETYDTFHAIFVGALDCRPLKLKDTKYANGGDNAYGYAKKDLNGDGIEELILLSDQFKMIAVFTEINGTAVFLQGTSSTWVDEKGLFRKEKYTGGMTGRDREFYLYEMSGGEIKCKLAIGYRANFTLKKENWYKIERGVKTDITQEEGDGLYAQYDILPEGYMGREYMREFSGLEFVSLFEKTLATKEHLHKFENMSYINRGELEITSFSDNKVSFIYTCPFTIGNYDPENPDEIPQTVTTVITSEASYKDGVYYFEKDGIKGNITFAVNAVWLDITASNNEYVKCRTFLFNSLSLY